MKPSLCLLAIAAIATAAPTSKPTSDGASVTSAHSSSATAASTAHITPAPKPTQPGADLPAFMSVMSSWLSAIQDAFPGFTFPTLPTPMTTSAHSSTFSSKTSSAASTSPPLPTHSADLPPVPHPTPIVAPSTVSLVRPTAAHSPSSGGTGILHARAASVSSTGTTLATSVKSASSAKTTPTFLATHPGAGSILPLPTWAPASSESHREHATPLPPLPVPSAHGPSAGLPQPSGTAASKPTGTGAVAPVGTAHVPPFGNGSVKPSSAATATSQTTGIVHPTTTAAVKPSTTAAGRKPQFTNPADAWAEALEQAWMDELEAWEAKEAGAAAKVETTPGSLKLSWT